MRPYEPTIINSDSESDGTSSADDGVCALHSDPNSVIVLTDSYSNTIDIPAGSKVPENSKMEIICKTGLVMPNGEKSQQSVCSRKDGWVPSLTKCLSKYIWMDVSSFTAPLSTICLKYSRGSPPL